MYNRKAFKKEARQLMREAKPHYMVVALVYFLLTSGLSYVCTALTGSGTVLGGTLSVFLNILVWLFGLVLGVGLAGYALRLSRKEQVGVGSLFDGFAFAGRSIGMNILVMIYMFLWTMLAAVGFAVIVALASFLMERVMALGIILVVVAYIALIVVVVAIVLRYAMASFALVEKPDDGAHAAIRRSVQMMRKNKGKLFVMELSFIGWSLLIGLIGLTVLGIGVFVSGMSWMFAELVSAGEDVFGMLGMAEGLLNQMAIWSILGELICWPLSMWLIVYMQTSYAKFYNYVSGYDYHQYMNGGAAAQETAPAEALAGVVAEAEPAAAGNTSAEGSGEEPVRVPDGGYYTPVPALESEVDEELPAAEEEAPVQELSEDEEI